MRKYFSFLLAIFLVCVACTPKPKIKFEYREEGKRFSGKVEANKLKSNGQYVFCINGKENQDGNELLCQHKRGKSWGNECYYDFKTVVADDNGNLSESFNIKLLPGEYDVTFLIKDAGTQDYECIYIRDHVTFEINPSVSPSLNISQSEDLFFKITSLVNGSVITKPVITVIGEHKLDPDKDLVWILLRDDHGNYYLQNPSVQLFADGTWRAIGVRPGMGIRGIEAVLVTQGGHNIFMKKVEGGDFAGFTVLPEGTSRLDSIRIIRK